MKRLVISTFNQAPKSDSRPLVASARSNGERHIMHTTLHAILVRLFHYIGILVFLKGRFF